MADSHANFAYSTVSTAPSPANSGTSLVVASGTGSVFPTAPFNATVWPAGSQPTSTNAEIIRVTNVATDTFTITRAQENTSAVSIAAGYQIAATITAKTLTDIESSAMGVASMWFPFNEAVNVAGQQGQSTLQLVPLPTPALAAGGELNIDRVCLPIYFSNGSNSTGSVTLTMNYGLYTKNDSSLSLFASTSRSEQITYQGNDASSASKRGVKLFTIGWTTTIPDNRYYIGIFSQTASAGNNATISQILISQMNSNFSGILNEATNKSLQWPLGYGVYSAATNAFPDSIGFSQLNGTNSLAARAPSWFAISGTM